MYLGVSFTILINGSAKVTVGTGSRGTNHVDESLYPIWLSLEWHDRFLHKQAAHEQNYSRAFAH